MLYSCPNLELSREMIIQKIYARLSLNDRTMLDTSCAGSYMLKTIEFKWDLLERIKRNSKDWDLDEGKESGITPKFDCVKSFMDTDVFREFSTKYGLDSEIVASFCESFATHVDLPKEKWFKYNPPIEVKVVAPIKVEEKTITYNDPFVPTAYIEKPPFPVRIKDDAKASTMVNKSNIKTPKPLSKLMLNLVLLWLKISWPIKLMGMLFTSVIKLLELLDLVLKINIDLL